MKKSILLFIVGILFKISLSNPIVTPPILTEVYLDGNDIKIEVCFQLFYYDYLGIYNLDDFQLVSNSSTVDFEDGINIMFNQPMVLDNDDLDGIFTFDPAGDCIYLSYDNNGPISSGDDYRFGNDVNAQVISPQPGQSIAMLGNYVSYYGYYYSSGYGIEVEQTIGSNPWEVNSRGGLEGWIYDINNEPIEGLQVFDVFTDETGYFLKSDLLCKIFNYIRIKHNGYTIYVYQDTIYPNETSQVTLYLDTTFVGIPEYFNYPNPIINLTRFSINIPDNLEFSTSFLSIYNMAGKQVDKIEITKRQQDFYWSSRGVEPGLYIYNLMLNGKTFGSKKMIIQ